MTTWKTLTFETSVQTLIEPDQWQTWPQAVVLSHELTHLICFKKGFGGSWLQAVLQLCAI